MATRSEGFGEEVARRIMAGNFVLSESAYVSKTGFCGNGGSKCEKDVHNCCCGGFSSKEYFDQARKVASQLKAEFAACYEAVDVLLAPTAPLLPFPLSDKPAGTKVLLNDIMTVIANLTGVPAVSLPVKTVKETYTAAGKQPVTLDLPVSVQVFGRWLGEGAMLQAARAIEERVCYQKPLGI
jgi:aspartyl-tRNA(Asn)/glutamyl-tRNA(Gln) amidotransferase subunit A